MKTLKELNEERSRFAATIYDPAEIRRWEKRARADAEQDVYAPPQERLLEHVYMMAWSRKRDKLGRAERDAAKAKYAGEVK